MLSKTKSKKHNGLNITTTLAVFGLLGLFIFIVFQIVYDE